MFNYGVCVVLQSNSVNVIYAVSQFYTGGHPQLFVPAPFTCPECDLREFRGTSILPCGVPVCSGIVYMPGV